jgi:hypothetical protein
MTTNYKDYIEARKRRLPYYNVTAQDALCSIRNKQKLKEKLESIGCTGRLYTDSDNVCHIFKKHGYTITLKIECDDNSHFDDINHQDYGVENARKRFIDEQDNKRYSGGDMVIYKDLGDRNTVTYRFDLPESYIRQFYNAKLGKARAYDAMVASTKQAIDQDIKSFTQECYYISVAVTDIIGTEIFNDGLGGCDFDFATSGAAFFECDMIESAIDHIMSDIEKQARLIESSRPDMYNVFQAI